MKIRLQIWSRDAMAYRYRNTMIQNRNSVELGEKMKKIILTKILIIIIGDILGF